MVSQEEPYADTLTDSEFRSRSEVTRGRLVNLIQAAFETVSELRESVAQLGRQMTDLGVHDQPVRAELREVRNDIERNRLLSEGATFSLDQMLEKEDALTVGEVVARLSSIERLLAAQERRLRADGEGPVPPRDHKSPLAANEANPLQEAALLATITERFYGSATFKALGIALVAAVLLATTGTILIGNQSINLRDNLDKTAKAAEAEITRQRSQAEDRIGTQQKQAKESLDSFEAQRAAYEQRIRGANDQIEQKLTLFLANSKQLEDSAVKTAVEALRKDMDTEGSALRKSLQEAEKTQENSISEEGRRQLGVLGSTLQPLQDRMQKQAAAIGDFETTVQKSKVINDQLALLQPLAEQAKETRAALSGLTDTKEKLTQAASTAEQQANAAQTAAKQAESARANVANTLRKVNTDLGEQLEAIGHFQERNNRINQGLNSVDDAARTAVSDIQKRAREFPDKEARQQFVDAGKLALAAAMQAQVTAVQPTLAETVRKASEEAVKDAAAAHTAAAATERDAATAKGLLGGIGQNSKAAEDIVRNWPKPPSSDTDWLQQRQVILVHIQAIEDEILDIKDPVPTSQAKLSLEQRKRVQRALQGAHFYAGNIDGDFRQGMTAAIRAFQDHLHQPLTGQLTPEQLRFLWRPAVEVPTNAIQPQAASFAR